MSDSSENGLAFSIALIARNEASNLPRLFAGLAEYSRRGGEILVVDTGSEDNTVALAREHGARVIEMPAQFDFFLSAAQAARIEQAFARAGETLELEVGQRIFHMGRARQFATQNAARDFVFMPDGSDELLAFDTDWLDAQLREKRASGFSYRQQYGTATLVQSRFYDRRFLEWRGAVHEALFARDDLKPGVLPASPPSVRCAQNRLWLRHHRSQKTRNYMAGMALDLLDDPRNPRWQHYLGREFFYFRKWRSAIDLLEKHAANEAAWVLERNESWCLIGQCYEELGEDAAARNAYERAQQLVGARREPLLRLARLAKRHGDFADCVALCRAALRIETRSDFSEADENFSHLPHALLYWSLFWLGAREEAARHWQKCCALDPEHPQFLADAKLFGDRKIGGETNVAQTGAGSREKIELHVLTRCSRPQNLSRVKASVLSAPDTFHVIWHVLFDVAQVRELSSECLDALCEPNIVASFHRSVRGDFGHDFLNRELDKIAEGWVVVLDDDNLMHPLFYERIGAAINAGDCAGIVFSQEVAGRDFTGLQIRRAAPENMRAQRVDMAQFVLQRRLIAGHRFPLCDVMGDGVFIAELYRAHPEQFRFLEEVLCYYNALAE